MKTQARLRLRQVGRHHGVTCRGWADKFGVLGNLGRAFEMNCWAKHYDDTVDPPPIYRTMNYVTGRWTETTPQFGDTIPLGYMLVHRQFVGYPAEGLVAVANMLNS